MSLQPADLPRLLDPARSDEAVFDKMKQLWVSFSHFSSSHEAIEFLTENHPDLAALYATLPEVWRAFNKPYGFAALLVHPSLGIKNLTRFLRDIYEDRFRNDETYIFLNVYPPSKMAALAITWNPSVPFWEPDQVVGVGERDEVFFRPMVDQWPESAFLGGARLQNFRLALLEFWASSPILRWQHLAKVLRPSVETKNERALKGKVQTFVDKSSSWPARSMITSLDRKLKMSVDDWHKLMLKILKEHIDDLAFYETTSALQDMALVFRLARSMEAGLGVTSTNTPGERLFEG